MLVLQPTKYEAQNRGLLACQLEVERCMDVHFARSGRTYVRFIDCSVMRICWALNPVCTVHNSTTKFVKNDLISEMETAPQNSDAASFSHTEK